jgi:hydrogenase nickel incorporation protein HypA/HybF
MHETSLVRSLLAQVDELCAAHGGDSIQEVRVELGPLSGVEPLLMADAFNRQRGDWAAAATAKLIVDRVPLEVRCLACGNGFQPARFNFRCPGCQSGDTKIVRGDGVLLQCIILRDSTRGAVA